ncbi:MAG: ZIP family metal transporter [Candidatus Peregrinibacteria bacterium]|nr:ZIP family metal transporter [Candidatus Peregrinibacteria bacterium]
MQTPLYVIGSVLVVSLVSLAGISLFLVSGRAVRKLLLYVVSFSTGGLLGDVFIHMLPEMQEEDAEFFGTALLIVLASIVFSFAIEKLIHWRHCHVLPENDHEHDHCHSAGLMTLFGDGVHNFIDGLVIAVAFLVSIPVGLSTTLAVIFHEIPQEIGNFAVLLHDGYSRGRALFYNFLSALTAILGAVLVLLSSSSFEGLSKYMLPFAAGNFLYIAGSDLIPELHKERGLGAALLQIISMILGILVMYALGLLE